MVERSCMSDPDGNYMFSRNWGAGRAKIQLDCAGSTTTPRSPAEAACRLIVRLKARREKEKEARGAARLKVRRKKPIEERASQSRLDRMRVWRAGP